MTDTHAFEAWLGREESVADPMPAFPATALAAVLDQQAPGTGGALPPLWHWTYFLQAAPQAQIGADGHPRRGGFLPAVDLPRRMWAGSRLRFQQPLRLGQEAVRRSRIAQIRAKEGRSGPLVFVTVTHDITTAGKPVLQEEQDIVYRGAPTAGEPAAPAQMAPTDETFSRRITPDAALLFRYSALTFNSHRIHYDQPYATTVEGYPGLVVHGPLIATLLVDLARREVPRLEVLAFEFKAVHPLFDLHPFTVCGRPESPGRLRLWARDHAGRLAMDATLEHTT